MSWISKNDYSDERARAMTDQTVAAFEDKRPEATVAFDRLTTEAMFHMSDEQWQELQETLRQKGSTQ